MTLKDGFHVSTPRTAKMPSTVARDGSTWVVTAPDGSKVARVDKAGRYSHALVRANKSTPGHYYVSFASSHDKALKESRVFAEQRAYVEIVTLEA